MAALANSIVLFFTHGLAAPRVRIFAVGGDLFTLC